GASYVTYEEKMTDVRIATEFLFDAFNDSFDSALIVSGDSDLVPPIDAVRKLYPSKRIVIAFPPARNSGRLRKTATAYFRIGEANLRKSMFAETVVKPDGFILKRPVEWERNKKQ
ncbi:MAG: NYN domain-containing protein, partial [Candidatus Latescibacterota bacterium]